MSPISSVPFSLKVTTVSGGSRSSTVTARAKKKKEGKKIEKFESEEDRLKNFVLPEGDQQLRENLRATAEERIKQVIGEQEELGDVMTPEGFQKLKEKIQKESEEMLNKSFDEAKEKIRSNFNERLDAIEAQRREQQQKNLEMIAEMKRQDDEEMDRLYRENIEPLKKDRAEMQRLVDELREEEQSSKRNVGLFFQNLYGAPTPRKERALRPQSAESGKLKFLEENASDAKELGKATRTAIEDLQTKAEMQAEPFKRAAYSVIGAIVVLNVAKWILEHNPFQYPSKLHSNEAVHVQRCEPAAWRICYHAINIVVVQLLKHEEVEGEQSHADGFGAQFEGCDVLSDDAVN
eukprot:CAMPEP_0184481168 /NCGR_PEP_ID=MMETSP0113_2-20130426/2699_1 /TAXON_ID=91329 /ORGANISM="Norrisiella sphaerica, Strain BC52" /LENGTH=348 /DNA_ID=CAMNT_0026860107 /DNA_START=527 /DNA_END=1574 /DNA_ORIENTATION=-